MKINICYIKGQKQIFWNSCIPMSVECVLKLLNLMPINDFSLQNDPLKIGTSDWVRGFKFPIVNPKIEFSREFMLSDDGITKDEDNRGSLFMINHFDNLFDTIDNELANKRYVIISLQSEPTPTGWHMHIIYNKLDAKFYELITFDFNNQVHELNTFNLKQKVTSMMGTDILTYKEIK